MRTLPLLLTALGLVAPGCGGDFCTKVYDKKKECASSDELGHVPDKAEYVEKCTAEQKKEKDAGTFDEEALKAQMECLDKESCDDVKTCMRAESEKAYVKKQVKEIGAAAASDDVEKMKKACQYIDEEKSELVEACKPVMVKLVDATMKEVTKMRDEGKHDYGVCGDLERFGAAVGDDVAVNAKKLCVEAQASEKVAKAIAEANTNAKANKTDIPFECEMSLTDLKEIDSDWAKTKKAEVVKACYEDLGLVIMEAKVDEMQYVCDFQVGKVYRAVKEHGIENEKMKPWMTKADPLCGKEG